VPERRSAVDVQPIVLIGSRAKLTPMESSHVAALYEAGRSPEIWPYMPMWIRTVDDMHRLVREALRARERGSEFPFVIIDQETGRIAGSTRFLEITPTHRGIEIGWTWLSPDAWRSSINTECKYLLLRHCFEVLGAIRVQLKTDARNVRSQTAIERIGGVREGVLRHHRIMPDGYLRDSVYYSILVEEWPAVKARLEGYLGRAPRREVSSP
jgi:RimJ/RimL family protein N-acetyltransferase